MPSMPMTGTGLKVSNIPVGTLLHSMVPNCLELYTRALIVGVNTVFPIWQLRTM